MFNEENHGIIVIVIFCILFAIYIYLVPSSMEEKEKHVKHVHFSDDTNIFYQTKTSILQYIKSIFFKSHIQNGILKSTKYTSDSSYAELFG
jgi:hypothetical protein